MSIQTLAAKHGLCERSVYKRSANEGWKRARAEYKAGVATEAMEQQHARDVAVMSDVLNSVNVLIEKLVEALKDPQQLYRYYVPEGKAGNTEYVEKTSRKLDAKTAKDMMSTLKDAMLVKATILRVPTIRDLHDAERLKIEMSREARENASASVNHDQTLRVVLAPEIEEMFEENNERSVDGEADRE